MNSLLNFDSTLKFFTDSYNIFIGFPWDPKDSGEDTDGNDPLSSTNISFPSPLTRVTPEQALEILLLLSQNSNVADYIKLDRGPFLAGNNDQSLDNTSQSGPRSCSMESESIEPLSVAEVQIIQSIETLPTGSVNKDAQVEQVKLEEIGAKIMDVVPSTVPEDSIDDSNRTVTDELCQNKFDELKQLLSDARKAVNSIVHTQESSVTEITSEKESSSNVDIKEVENTEDVKVSTETTDLIVDKEISENENASVDSWTSSNASRAGKYNKKPAPKAPLARSEEDLEETDSQNALKATLVIKTGTLKTFSNTGSTKDVFIATDAKSKGKKSKKQRTKDGFSKLLTIPKNIFHNAFSKEQKGSARSEDSVSDISTSESRSNSIESQETIIELAPKLSRETNLQTDDTSNSSDSYVLAPNNDPEEVNDVKEETKEDKSSAEIREMSRSPKAGKRLESDIY